MPNISSRQVITVSGLAKKLGLKPEMTVCLLEATPASAALIRAASPTNEHWDEALNTGPDGIPHRRYDLIFFWPRHLEGLAERFATLQHHIVPDGAIWAIFPKKKFLRKYGIDFSWDQMQQAGLQTDLVDNKIASVSDDEYGTRFVIRKDRRPAYH